MAKARRNSNSSNNSIDSLIARLEVLEVTYATRYYASANTSGSTTTPFSFDTKVHDDHNLVTQSPWRFTAPVNGIYMVSGVIRFSTTGTLNIYKNGVSYGILAYDPGAFEWTGTVDVQMLAGDYIDLRPASGSATIAGGAQNGLISTLDIKKVGSL